MGDQPDQEQELEQELDQSADESELELTEEEQPEPTPIVEPVAAANVEPVKPGLVLVRWLGGNGDETIAVSPALANQLFSTGKFRKA